MKRQKQKLTLNKFNVSRLTSLSSIKGGDGDDDGTLKSRIPTRCKTTNGNGNGLIED